MCGKEGPVSLLCLSCPLEDSGHYQHWSKDLLPGGGLLAASLPPSLPMGPDSVQTYRGRELQGRLGSSQFGGDFG